MPRLRPPAALLAAGLMLVPPVALAQDAAPEPPADAGVRGDEFTPQSRAAVERGLAWLATRQAADGSFGTGRTGGTAITALSAIALMSAGHLPGRGRYGDVVQRAVDNVVAQAQPSGLLCPPDASGVMYHHGFAALLLGEVYGMTGDERIKEPLRRAIRLIEQSQNPEGGWRYQPVPVDADVSVTICQVMALRAARDAGIKVEKQVIDDAVEYVRKCQNPDGGFNYQRRGRGSSAFARSAAGVATLYYAGVAEADEVDRGLEYILRSLPGDESGRTQHYFYGHYYAAQATFMAGGETWATWFPAIRDELVGRQEPTGAWNGEQSGEYATAMALIILQMPNRYLPVFSGKGPGS